jgi:hypothetical protein
MVKDFPGVRNVYLPTSEPLHYKCLFDISILPEYE